MNNILLYMLNNKDKAFTINQLAKETKTNYRIAHKKIKQFEQEGIIKTTRVGKALQCSLTSTFNENIFLAEYEKRTALPKKIHKVITKLNQIKQVSICLLFGSYAKGNQTKHSDIDILIIAHNQKEIMEHIELIPENIHLTFVTYEDFCKMQKSKEISVVSEAVKNNVILLGTEEYYRLLQNAQ